MKKHNRKCSLFFLLLTFSISSLKAQQKQIDSLLQLTTNSRQDSTLSNLYLKLSKGYAKTGDFEKGQVYSEKSFLHSQKISFMEGMARAKIQAAKIESDQGKYENARALLKEVLEIRKQMNDTQGFILILLKLGIVESNLSNPDNEIEQYKRAAQLAIQSHDSVYLARAYNNIGSVYQSLAKYTEAISYFVKSLKISEKINDHFTMAMTLSTIGDTYTMLNNGTEALRYLRRSLAISTQQNLIDAQISALTNMQRAFDRTNQLDSLLYYNKISLELMKERNEPILIARVDNNIADAFARMNELDSALFYISEAIDLSRESEDKTDAGVFLVTKAEILIKIAKQKRTLQFYKEALANLREAVAFSADVNDPDNLKDCYRLMSQAYSGLNQFEDAYNYHLKFSQLNDSINNSTFTMQVVEMNTKYETEKKDRAIAENKVQMSQKEIELTKKSNANKMLLAGVGGLILVIVFGVVSFNQRQKLMSRKKEIEKQKALEQARAAIASDLHDDIGSTLSSVQFMSAFALQSIDHSNVDAKQWVQKIETNAGDLIQNIRDIVWTLNPANDNAADIIIRMKHFAAQILEPKNIQFHFNSTADAEKYLDNLIAKRNVFLIYKEAVNNAAKYADASLLNINLSMQNGKMQMVIADNGKGFATNIASGNGRVDGGNGLKNMKKRAEVLNGEISLQSNEKDGTIVTLIC